MNAVYTIFGVVICVLLVTLALSVFNNGIMCSNSNINSNIVYSPTIEYDDIYTTNRTLTVDCDTMDLDNAIIYLNGWLPADYYRFTNDRFKYYYEYDCDTNLMYVEVHSKYPVIIGVDLQIT